MNRASGVLLPVTSLPSKGGIGGFSEEAYRFVDLLAEAGQSYWQVLPLGPVGPSGSPYQSMSTFAGNPLLISPDLLARDGLLTEEECRETVEAHPDAVDYEEIEKTRPVLLRRAYQRFQGQDKPESYHAFEDRNREWLHNYCLFCAIAGEYGTEEWNTWPEDLRNHEKEALDRFAREHAEDLGFYAFEQYEFDLQWMQLKSYANEKQVEIIGDIPIYVAMNSVDAWAEPELFQVDEENKPTGVSGCPPDAFSATGQLWGNPLYDWEHHRKTGYAWWIRRMRRMTELYDVVRIDHFRGFHDYWSIPYGDETAENGHWEKGPGLDLFRHIEAALGSQRYIAEDLGDLNDGVRKLVKDSGYPGMKVLEFAFDSDFDNEYLPHHYSHNCVVYTGTHDNDTLVGWLGSAGRKIRRNLRLYIGHPVRRYQDLIRLAMASTADLCIIPLQDWLGLDGSARMNTPNTVGQNWKWRLLPGQFGEDCVKQMRGMTEVYSRTKNSKGE